MGKRTRYSAEFKAKVALDAIQGEQTLSELASRHGINPTQIRPPKLVSRVPCPPFLTPTYP